MYGEEHKACVSGVSVTDRRLEYQKVGFVPVWTVTTSSLLSRLRLRQRWSGCVTTPTTVYYFASLVMSKHTRNFAARPKKYQKTDANSLLNDGKTDY